MKVVHLPMLPATTPLKDAVKAMRIQQRSAVVREDPTKLRLIKIGKIFKALGDRLTQLSNVSDGEAVYEPTRKDIAQYNLDIKNPQNAMPNWQSFLDQGGHSYALVDWYAGSALIVTQHEPQGDEIEMSPESCYCRGPFEHSIPPATIVPVRLCSICGARVHCE